MKKNLIVILICIFAFIGQSNSQERVRISTTEGDMVVQLYPETKLHKENFLRLVNLGFYDSLLFHRVIRDFMIQTGNPTTRPSTMEDVNVKLSKVPAEIYPKYIHKKGALASARQPDDVNPDRKSSSSQFYIVQGTKYPRKYMSSFEEKNKMTYTEFQKDQYEDLGGSPHLDGAYTVFGEVVQGLSVIDKIAILPTSRGDKPTKGVYIIKMEVIN